MSHKIGKNHDRNVANRKTPEAPKQPSVVNGVVKYRDGTKYRIGSHGELIRIRN